MRLAYPNALVALFFGCGAIACQASSDKDEGRLPSSTSKPELRAGQSLGDAPACGVDAPPCEGGRQCASVDLAGGAAEPRCVDAVAVCEKLQCATGDCGILESFPAMITCLGATGEGGGGDPGGSVSHASTELW